MAIPTGTPTTTSSISNLVQAAYDQYVRMALRSIPVMRSLADVKPVQQAMPGSSVVFSIYSDLAQATSTLTETSDVSSIALGNPSQVTVTLNEYGSAVTKEDFFEDLSRFKYIKKLLRRYVKSGELKTNLLINHFIIVFNVFNDAAILSASAFAAASSAAFASACALAAAASVS